MLVTSLFEYALLRVVPRVERGEFINAGVVLYCPEARFLDARVHLDPERLRTLDPGLESGPVLGAWSVGRPAVSSPKYEFVTETLPVVCPDASESPEAGAVGLLPPGQRFGWLVAPRSTVVQPSPVHTGFSDDPEAALEHLLRVMVYPPDRDQGAQLGTRS